MVFTRTLRVAADVPAGAYPLTCSIRYQACTATLCLPPRAFDLRAVVRVR